MELNYGEKEIDGVKVKPVSCNTALSNSRLEADYSLNPYIGCLHNCTYCYGPSVIQDDRSWGEFLEVKINLPKVLSQELKTKSKGVVRLGSVTDPYQEAEKEYEVTKKCLKQLKKDNFSILIQTKSDLVKRDIDLLSEMDSDVGLTITSLDDDFRKKYEPNAPPISDRLSTIKELKERGVGVWVFIGPLFPHLNDMEDELVRLSKTLDSLDVDEIYLDKLNMRKRIWNKIEPKLEDELVEEYKEIYFGEKDYFKKNKKLYKKIGKPVF